MKLDLEKGKVVNLPNFAKIQSSKYIKCSADRSAGVKHAKMTRYQVIDSSNYQVLRIKLYYFGT